MALIIKIKKYIKNINNFYIYILDKLKNYFLEVVYGGNLHERGNEFKGNLSRTGFK